MKEQEPKEKKFQILMSGVWKPTFVGPQLVEGDFQQLTNMRYTMTPGIKSVLGMSQVGSISFLAGTVPFSEGAFHTLAVDPLGSVWAWGNDDEGQIGDAVGGLGALPFPAVPSPFNTKGVGGTGTLSGITNVAAGSFHSIALGSDGSVYCWGYATNGQCGQNTDGAVEAYLTPVKVLGPLAVGFLSGITKIAAGGYHSLAIKSDGTVWGWGFNSGFHAGTLGDGSSTDALVPVQMLGPNGVGFMTNAVAIAGGYDFSAVVTSDGSVYATGLNNCGQLGQGNTTASLVPLQVKGVGGVGFLSGITKVAIGLDTSSTLVSIIALKGSDGSVYGWGKNRFGCLGDNTTTQRTTPVQTLGVGGVGTLSGMVDIANGNGNFSLAASSSGNVYAWGVNSSGQLGQNSTSPIEIHTPVEVMGVGGVGFLSNIKTVRASYAAIAASSADAKLYAWGENFTNQFGDGTTTPQSAPIVAAGGKTWLLQ